MAQISKLWWLRHLRAEPNQFVLHFEDGRIKRRGSGLNYWFSSYSAAIADRLADAVPRSTGRPADAAGAASDFLGRDLRPDDVGALRLSDLPAAAATTRPRRRRNVLSDRFTPRATRTRKLRSKCMIENG